MLADTNIRLKIVSLSFTWYFYHQLWLAHILFSGNLVLNMTVYGFTTVGVGKALNGYIWAYIVTGEKKPFYLTIKTLTKTIILNSWYK